MSDENTYQPHWGEEREHRHRHHHHHHNEYKKSSNNTNTWGGWMKLRDKQAYYGLMLIVIAALGYGLFRLVAMVVEEVRQMPLDDPDSEMRVDELRIQKVEEQDAIQYGDSLAKAEDVDTLRRTVQIDTRPVYRPPKREDTWYITKREWKAIWKDYKVWRYERKQAKEQRKQAKEQRRREREEKRKQRKQK